MSKKIVFILLALLMFSGFAFAKDITVIFNFPSGTYGDVEETLSVEEGATAFDAFVQSAENNELTLEVQYFGESPFISGVNDVFNSDTEYWLVWSNYVNMPQVGVGDYVPADGEIIELAYGEFPLATELIVNTLDGETNLSSVNLYVNGFFIGESENGIFSETYNLKKDTYELKAVYNADEIIQNFEITVYGAKEITVDFLQNNSESEIVTNAFEWLVQNQKEDGEIGEHKVWGNAFALMALSTTDNYADTTDDAIQYLMDLQYEDAGFGYPGFGSDAGHTAVAITGLLANGKNLSKFERGGVTSIEYLLEKQQDDGGFLIFQSSDVDTTSWAIVAIVQAGYSLPSKNGNFPVDYLLGAQNDDGGLGYNKDSESSVDWSSEALLALAAAQYEKDSAVEQIINYLRDNEDESGCYGNAYLTAIAALALNSYKEDVSSNLNCLENLQKEDGGFGRNETSNSVDTSLAILALKEKTFPLEKENGEDGGENVLPVNSVIKFVVPVTNVGRVSAFNIFVQLFGVEDEWITFQSNTFNEIEPNETKDARIYVNFPNTGEYDVYAQVSSDQSGTTATKVLNLIIDGTQFIANIFVEE